MKNKFKALIEKFDLQPIRIRLLLTFVVVLVIGFAVDMLWISPTLKQSKQLQNEIKQTEEIIVQLMINQKELNNSIINQRQHPNRKQLDQVRELIVDIKSELEEKTINLIKPELMGSVLKDIVNRSKDLKLVSLIKQPPQPLFTKEGGQDGQENKQQGEQLNEQQVQIYQHSVEMILEGSFSDTQEFLTQLESMQQKVNFENIQYEVEEYPISKITLVVSSLSLDRKWIGG